MSSLTPAMRRWAGQCSGAGLGVVADMIVGEPPLRPHPLAIFGRAMDVVEDWTWRDSRGAGVLHAGIGVVVGAGAGRLVGYTAAATYLAVAGRALSQAAEEVAAPLRAGNLERARRLLPALVGRDPTGLDEMEICRAVVESIAENTVDAIVAPALWGALGGAPGALAYRAINTLDARVGHHNDRYERFGWASARLDDAANLAPTRLTALLVAAVRPRRAGAVRHAVWHQAGAHPSPNAGVVEAAFAAALGVGLGGKNRYGDRIEIRPPLGAGPPPEPGDIARAQRLSRHVSLALAAALAVTGWALRRRVGR